MFNKMKFSLYARLAAKQGTAMAGYIGKSLFIFMLAVPALIAQEFKATDVRGDVKYQAGTSEVWSEVKEGMSLQPDYFISTGEKSFVKVKYREQSISIDELSAIHLASIKTMSTDELLLALAMEDMINAPVNDRKNRSSSTAVYGDKKGNENNLVNKSDDFGIKRLNGAVQLAGNGFKESSVVFAKETYRKYPDSKQIPLFRIFFADILYEKGLYEEALGEYLDSAKLDLNNEEKTNVESQIQRINKILLNN